MAFSVALYSWSHARSSSPGSKRSDARTVETPAVAFGTKASPSGSALTKMATSRRAESSSASSSRARNRTGWRSIRSRQARCASRTGSGHAPKPPWLRYETSPSSRHGARSWTGRATALPERHRERAAVRRRHARRIGAGQHQERATRARDAPRAAGAADDQRPLLETDPGERPARVDRRPPSLEAAGREVRHDGGAGHDAQARHRATSRPEPLAEGHRSRARSGEAGAAIVGPRDRGPGDGPGEQRRDQVG